MKDWLQACFCEHDFAGDMYEELRKGGDLIVMEVQKGGAKPSDKAVRDVCSAVNELKDVVVQSERRPATGETLLGATVSFLPGGKGLNQAIAAVRQGVPTAMVGAVGNDAFANSLRSFLADNDVDCSGVREVDGPATGVAIIQVAEGDNAITVASGANLAFHAEGLRELPVAGEIWVAQLSAIPLRRCAPSVLPTTYSPDGSVHSTRRRSRSYSSARCPHRAQWRAMGALLSARASTRGRDSSEPTDVRRRWSTAPNPRGEVEGQSQGRPTPRGRRRRRCITGPGRMMTAGPAAASSTRLAEPSRPSRVTGTASRSTAYRPRAHFPLMARACHFC